MDSQDDLLLCKQEEYNIDSNGSVLNETTTTTTTLKYDNHQSYQDDIISQLAGAGTVGVAAAAAILSSKHNSRHNYHFETNPAVRKRQQTRLLRKLNELADEYAARCGQQICVICCTPTKVINKQTVFKVFGTQPLETVVKNQRNNILIELDNLLQSTIIDDKDHQDQQQQQQHLLNDESINQMTTTAIASSATNTNRFELPPLTIDGIPTSLETMTQCQLRMFIPLLLKYSTGRQKPGWNRIECKPIWWPAELPWANIRVDPRDEESKKKHPWTEVLKQVIRNCYKYHGREDLLHKFNNIEPSTSSNNSNKQNKSKKISSPIETKVPIMTASSSPPPPQSLPPPPPSPAQQTTNGIDSNQQQSTYTVLQHVRNLDGGFVTLVEQNHQLTPLTPSTTNNNNNNNLDGSPIILHTDSADSINTNHHNLNINISNQQSISQTHNSSGTNVLDFNMNEYHNLWNHHHQQSNILLSTENNNHYEMLVDEVEDEQSKEDNIIELACINKKHETATSSNNVNTILVSNNYNNDFNDLQMIKHKRFRLCNNSNIITKSIDHHQINDSNDNK